MRKWVILGGMTLVFILATSATTAVLSLEAMADLRGGGGSATPDICKYFPCGYISNCWDGHCTPLDTCSNTKRCDTETIHDCVGPHPNQEVKCPTTAVNCGPCVNCRCVDDEYGQKKCVVGSTDSYQNSYFPCPY